MFDYKKNGMCVYIVEIGNWTLEIIVEGKLTLLGFGQLGGSWDGLFMKKLS